MRIRSVFVEKPNGKPRICLKSPYLNKQLVRKPRPGEIIQEICLRLFVILVYSNSFVLFDSLGLCVIRRMATSTDTSDRVTEKPCKNCKNVPKSGYKCIKCASVIHPGCVKYLKSARILDEKQIICCENNLSPTSELDIGDNKSIDSDMHALKLELQYLHELLKHKDIIIRNQEDLINSLKMQIQLKDILTNNEKYSIKINDYERDLKILPNVSKISGINETVQKNKQMHAKTETGSTSTKEKNVYSNDQNKTMKDIINLNGDNNEIRDAAKKPEIALNTKLNKEKPC
ncbi:hypothetical protein FQR65_LT04267 [Abscondita terminalis]|nr:hypothetical protein FQR65_LT04267 [Abscondita terminalis]